MREREREIRAKMILYSHKLVVFYKFTMEASIEVGTEKIAT